MEELLSRHLSRLRAYVRLRMGRLVRAKESSEDLVQSVCREALERLGDLEHRDEGGFRLWLFQRAERKVIERGRFYRRLRRDAAREVPLEVASSEEPEEAETLLGAASLFTPSRHASAREELDRLERAFAALSPDQREVVLLARIVGLPHQEIARRMGRTPAATWSLLSRALARLSTLLGE
jgi:RNA polymerase sigma-70 factor (ECF subfamily)